MKNLTEPKETGKSFVALLGPQIEHRESLLSMLGGEFGEIAWFPPFGSFIKSHGRPGHSRWLRVIDKVWGLKDSDYVRHVSQCIALFNTRLIIAYWGTIPLPELIAIKKSVAKVKIVLMVLCYPLAITSMGIARQNFFMRCAKRFLDGIIYPSHEMQSYFQNHVLAGCDIPSVVIAPCWPEAFQASKRRPDPESEPNLVYVGRTDLSGRTVHAADDIRPLMRELLGAGLHLHHAYSKETDDGHPRRHSFSSSPLPDIIEKMSAYDASLVAYNTGVCPRSDRFRFTVPDRLITSVAAGVPIAIPAGGYCAAKSYLADYPAVIEFNSAEDLAHTLADRSFVGRARDAAWQARHLYAASRYTPVLHQFLAKLL